ncbi:hypothetical protein [Maribacter thermophilus]|uniref:hypothetical protein n=1 Tax=Maribacter thermophilus TaxID=1197874 RepID=UPI000641530C|nr:hypothetical protein [Maribacter thermophilus]
MTVADFTYFLEHPTKVVDPLQTKQLEDILDEYPYFQAARALHLKGLKNLNSYKYNKALKTTAAYTTDRDVLFDFITSKDFLQYNPPHPSKEINTPTPSIAPEPQEEKPLIEKSEDEPLPQDTKDAENILDPKLFISKEPEKDETDELQLGTPLTFDKKEKYSFSEWLQLTSKKPIHREKEPGKEKDSKNTSADKTLLKKKKFDRIDEFIAKNPKIVPKESTASPVNIKDSIKIDKKELMTETLAKVYLEQKKYKKAIQAYKILSLKYPEKSGFFADRIKAVQKIQQENK